MDTIVKVENKNIDQLNGRLATDLAKASTPAEQAIIYSIHSQSVNEAIQHTVSQLSHYRKFQGSVNTALNNHHEANTSLHMDILGAPNSHYITLDGANDYLKFNSAHADLMDWTKEWAFGIEMTSVSSINDSSYTTLWARGQNEICLRKGGSNWGVYCFSNGTSVCQSNTWYAPSAGSKILVTCDGSRVKYYLDGTMRANMSFYSSVSLNNPSGDLTFGKGISKGNWFGGVNRMMMSLQPAELGVTQVAEYFVPDSDLTKASFYSTVHEFFPLGESDYNQLVGLKGVLTGSMENGSADDYVEF